MRESLGILLLCGERILGSADSKLDDGVQLALDIGVVLGPIGFRLAPVGLELGILVRVGCLV